MRRSTPSRPGLAALDVVLCTAVAVPIAAAMYTLVRLALGWYHLILGSSVGSPIL